MAKTIVKSLEDQVSGINLNVLASRNQLAELAELVAAELAARPSPALSNVIKRLQREAARLTNTSARLNEISAP